MSKEHISKLSRELVEHLVNQDGLDVSASMHRKIEAKVTSLLESFQNDIKTKALESLDFIMIQEENCLLSLVNLDDVKSELNKL